MNTVVDRRLEGSRTRVVGEPIGPANGRSTKAVAAEQAPPGMTQPRTAIHAAITEQGPRAAALRTALVMGSVAVAVFAWLAAAGSSQAAEPELASLLRGMAAIKGLLALAAAGLVWWRVGQPVSVRVAAAYIVCAWGLFASTALIWQLAFIPAAALLFHAAALVGLVLGLREGRQVARVGRQAPNPVIERTA